MTTRLETRCSEIQGAIAAQIKALQDVNPYDRKGLHDLRTRAGAVMAEATALSQEVNNLKRTTKHDTQHDRLWVKKVGVEADMTKLAAATRRLPHDPVSSVFSYPLKTRYAVTV